jgi:hypothetical protein
MLVKASRPAFDRPTAMQGALRGRLAERASSGAVDV